MDFDFIYFCDSSPEIGLGHLSRGIDIVNAFMNQSPKSKLAVKGFFHESTYEFIHKNLNRNIAVLDSGSNSNCSVGIIDTMFFPSKQDIDFDYIKRIKNNTNKLILLWDAIDINVPDEVDIVIDHLPYVRLCGNLNIKKYLGFEYTPVPNPFYSEFEYKHETGDILSIFGSFINPDVIIPFLLFLNEINCKNRKRILLSPYFSINFVNHMKNTYLNIEFLQNVDSVFNLIKKTSVVITTYGNTTFQALAAKVPVFNIAYQPFQEYYAQKLEEAGYSVNLGTFSKYNINKVELVFDNRFKRVMHNKLKRVFRKPGIHNIVDIIKNELDYN